MANLVYSYPAADVEGTGTTTGTGPKTLVRVPIAVGDTVVIEFTTIGQEAGGANSAGYVQNCTAKNVAGVVTVLGVDLVAAEETQAGWRTWPSANSPNVVLNAYGPVATVNWRCYARVRALRV